MQATSRRTALLTAAAIAGVVAILAAGTAVVAQAQTDTTNTPVDIDETAAEDAASPGSAGEPELDDERAETDTEPMVSVSGTLESPPGEDYRLDGLAIDIGAEWYTNGTTAETDFDGDGTLETIRSEFDGLVGQNVTVTVETDGTEGDVFAVGDDQYREQGPPPWAGGPNGQGPPAYAGPEA